MFRGLGYSANIIANIGKAVSFEVLTVIIKIRRNGILFFSAYSTEFNFVYGKNYLLKISIKCRNSASEP